MCPKPKGSRRISFPVKVKLSVCKVMFPIGWERGLFVDYPSWFPAPLSVFPFLKIDFTTANQVFILNRRYDPASPKRISGDHAAMAGGSWLKLPIASKRL